MRNTTTPRNVNIMPAISNPDIFSLRTNTPNRPTKIGLVLIITVDLARGINFNEVTANIFPPKPKIPLSTNGVRASFGILRISFFGFNL